MKKRTIAIMFSLILVVPALSLAGEYVLLKGKGVEVCEEYGKNLNSFKSNWPVPFGKLNPEFKDFSKPKWEWWMDTITRIKVGDGLFVRISDFFWKRDVNPAEFFKGDLSQWRGTKKQYAEAYKRYIFFRHEISAWKVPNHHLIAEVDIDNDGTPEPVYLDQMYTTPTLMLVLKPDYSDIDYEKTKLVMMHPSRKEAGWKDVRDISPEEHKKRPELKNWTKWSTSDTLHALSYDVFIYKSKTYFDLWGLADSGLYGGDEKLQRLRVFFSEKGRTSEICTYKFDPTNKK